MQIPTPSPRFGARSRKSTTSSTASAPAPTPSLPLPPALRRSRRRPQGGVRPPERRPRGRRPQAVGVADFGRGGRLPSELHLASGLEAFQPSCLGRWGSQAGLFRAENPENHSSRMVLEEGSPMQHEPVTVLDQSFSQHSTFSMPEETTWGEAANAQDGNASLYGASKSTFDDYELDKKGEEHLGDMISCVGTIWYRAPELLYGSERYGTEIDLWVIFLLSFSVYSHCSLENRILIS